MTSENSNEIYNNIPELIQYPITGYIVTQNLSILQTLKDYVRNKLKKN